MRAETPRKSLYKSKQWQSLRARQLRNEQLCQCPHHQAKDPEAIANVVDHIIPHRGDRHKFYDFSNLQSMTKQCHDKFKQSLEKGGRGFDQGCDTNGEPLNKDAAWYAQCGVTIQPSRFEPE